MDSNGRLIGKPHSKGGIKAIVKQSGKKIELEGNEYVLCLPAVNSKEEINLEGSAKHIIETIFEKFSCDYEFDEDGNLLVNKGEFVVCKYNLEDENIYSFEGTPMSIINHLQKANGCRTYSDSEPENVEMEMGGAIEVDNRIDLDSIKFIQNTINKRFDFLKSIPKGDFIILLMNQYANKVKLNRTSLIKMAEAYDITDITEIYELAEASWVLYYRYLVFSGTSSETMKETYDKLIDFYKNYQPTFTLRDSFRVILQQYSTAAPISFLMQMYCGVFQDRVKILEPTAGNGLLTFLRIENSVVNEIDETRNKMLSLIGFENIYNFDAKVKSNFDILGNDFNIVLANPPFGKTDHFEEADGYSINKLEELIMSNSLSKMTNDGRAAILVGGKTDLIDEEGYFRGKSKFFYNWLYHHYNVEDIININGDLYYKQGTTYDLRVILINGRKEKPSGFAERITDTSRLNRIDNFEDLYNRFLPLIKSDFIPRMNIDIPELSLPEDSDNPKKLEKKEQLKNIIDSFIPNVTEIIFTTPPNGLKKDYRYTFTYSDENQFIVADGSEIFKMPSLYDLEQTRNVRLSIKDNAVNFFLFKDLLIGFVFDNKNRKPIPTSYNQLETFDKITNEKVNTSEQMLIVSEMSKLISLLNKDDNNKDYTSKLNKTQQIIINSEPFKKWFGDWKKAALTKDYSECSVMVDRYTKEPLVVYHGSASNILDRLTPPIYTSKIYHYAQNYGNIYPFFIKAKKILDLTAYGLKFYPSYEYIANQIILPELKNSSTETINIMNKWVNLVNERFKNDYGRYISLHRFISILRDRESSSNILKHISENLGFDLIAMYESLDLRFYITAKVFVVLKENMIKDASGFNKTFSDYDSIFYEKGGEISE